MYTNSHGFKVPVHLWHYKKNYCKNTHFVYTGNLSSNMRGGDQGPMKISSYNVSKILQFCHNILKIVFGFQPSIHPTCIILLTLNINDRCIQIPSLQKINLQNIMFQLCALFGPRAYELSHKIWKGKQMSNICIPRIAPSLPSGWCPQS